MDDLRAEGGTAIAAALEEAFRLEAPEGRLPLVVFLTDGLPTVGEQNPERIAEAAERRRERARVFAFGVGYDVNTYLLDRLGEAGRGSTEYVEPGEDVERALGALAAKITHPVLTDLEIAGAPVRLTEIYPGELPDLFAGEELVVFGRYQGRGEGTLSVSGRRSGRTERFGTTASFPGRAEANDFLPRLWASRKLGELTRQVRLNGGDPELIEEIRQTALRYGLLSEYTSYLVQEPGVLADADLRSLRVLPWDAQVATVACGVYRPDGGRFEGDPRGSLERAVASLAELGLEARVGADLEFFLFRLDESATQDEFLEYYRDRVEVIGHRRAVSLLRNIAPFRRPVCRRSPRWARAEARRGARASPPAVGAAAHGRVARVHERAVGMTVREAATAAVPGDAGRRVRFDASQPRHPLALSGCAGR